MSVKSFLIAGASAFILAACQPDADTAPIETPEPPVEETQAVWDKGAMVAAADPRAVEAGLEVLRNGGHAVDAAIAVLTVLGLVEPQSSGIGGGAFMVVHERESGETTVYDGRETAPMAATENLFIEDGEVLGFLDAWQSGKSAGVPGAIALYKTAHDAHGTMDWASNFEAAITLAETGFVVSPRLASVLANDRLRMFTRVDDHPVSAAYFYPTGEPLAEGATRDNPDYANTLRRVASEGIEAFYTGEIAAAIVATVSEEPRPGAMTAEDFAAFEVKVRPPLCGEWRAYTICSAPPPSSGGVTQNAIAGLYDRLLPEGATEPEQFLRAFVDAQRLAYADRDHYVADADFVQVPAADLINPKYLDVRATEVFEPGAKPTPGDPGVALGGNPMMYVNLIWIWGHPEVYILTLPIFGIFSEIVPTFCRKRLFGYTSMVYATCVIMILSYIVWLHHFFTMGAGANVNSFFGITTMIISIPTGAKLFNWLFTMYKGRIRYELPMMWVVAFMLTFVIGGMTGVLLAVPPADYVLHNSLFLVAHFHNVIIGGVVFGIFAGINYWWPKAFGFQLDRFWGLVSFWGWVVGFYFAFMPLYVLGLMGVTRRLSQFEETIYAGYFFTALIGACMIAVGVAAFVVQIVVSIMKREELRDETGDPWGGRTLEWSTTSPPPYYNFAFNFRVYELDAWDHMKRNGYEKPTTGYTPIHMPHYTSSGVVIAGLMTVMGFALIWHVWWLALLSCFASLFWAIGHTFNYNRDYYIPADDVRKMEQGEVRITQQAAE